MTAAVSLSSLPQSSTGRFIAPHDHLQEVLGGGVRELAQAEVADDEQRDRRQLDEEGLAVPSSVASASSSSSVCASR